MFQCSVFAASDAASVFFGPLGAADPGAASASVAFAAATTRWLKGIAAVGKSRHALD